MEKKNTILLTVIAIATLLVAVVGATFAYFTAQVSTENNSNRTTNVQTAALVNAKMDMGSKISAENVLPGFETYKTVTVTGSCRTDASSCTDVNTTITLTAGRGIAVFGSHVKYLVYKKAASATGDMTCTNMNADGTYKYGTEDTTIVTEQDGDIVKYYDSSECTPSGLTAVEGGSGTFNGTTPVTIPVTVSGNTNDTYYILIEYENVEDDQQNNEQAKEFSVAIDFSVAEASDVNTTVTTTPAS